MSFYRSEKLRSYTKQNFK